MLFHRPPETAAVSFRLLVKWFSDIGSRWLSRCGDGWHAQNGWRMGLEFDLLFFSFDSFMANFRWMVMGLLGLSYEPDLRFLSPDEFSPGIVWGD